MGVRGFMRTHILGDPQAIEAYHTAWRDLESYTQHQEDRHRDGGLPDTEESERLQAQVQKTEQHVPSWRRR